MPRPVDIKFNCPNCGNSTRATIATGRLHRHSRPGDSTERCTGSRRLVFTPGQPGAPVDSSTPTPADFDWFAKKPRKIEPARLTAADISTAQRLLKAIRSDPKRYQFMRQPLQRFLDNAKTNRPDLFLRQRPMRVRRPATPIEAPSKTDRQALDKPSRRIRYREILVGKRN